MRSALSITILLLIFGLESCQESGNHLQNSNSLYLLQHAKNPVDWYPWTDLALDKAQKENKLLIVSIGYAACHWCHVMEEECFENDSVADFMNEHFISIKVDREERPDIDAIYQRASELSTGKGGWPLNVICLPDGKPFFAATYLPKNSWLDLLRQIQSYYSEDPDELLNSAEKITQAIQESQLITKTNAGKWSQTEIDSSFKLWATQWDTVYGGFETAPKFPMAVNLNCILDYAFYSNDSASFHFIETSLDRMAAGGLYDHLQGGFARYSTDSKWKVPHFEKMLYDNAQLISLYAKASKVFPNKNYLKIAKETAAFCEEHWMDNQGAFSSSTDADLDLEEGLYYTWTIDELRELIPESDWDLFKAYYLLNGEALWENGQFILQKDNKLAASKDFSVESSHFETKLSQWKENLLSARNLRPKPRVDDKKIIAWNALMVQAYAELYKASGEQEYLKAALRAGEWIRHQEENFGGLVHSVRLGKAGPKAFAQDFALASAAFIDLFLISSDTSYLASAEAFMKTLETEFSRKEDELFHTQSTVSNTLVANEIETADQVLPSTNSVIAHNLQSLALLLENETSRKKSEAMLALLKARTSAYPGMHAHWLDLALKQAFPYYEVVITGPEAAKLAQDLNRQFLPQGLVIWSNTESLPLFEQRVFSDTSWIYVCQFGSCQLPVHNTSAALGQMSIN